MNLEQLIVVSARKRPRKRRVTYAEVEAGLLVTKAEVLDALHAIRAPDVTAAEVRTTLRRVRRTFPRSEFTENSTAWTCPPEEIWRWALRSERTTRMARMTLAETEDALLRIIAGGPHEFWLLNRLNWAFGQGGPFAMFGINDYEGDAAEIAAGLFRLDQLYLDRLAAPEMSAAELVDLVRRVRAEPDRDEKSWEGDDIRALLDIQLPNAWLDEMVRSSHCDVDAESLVQEALARTRPDPSYFFRR